MIWTHQMFSSKTLREIDLVSFKFQLYCTVLDKKRFPCYNAYKIFMDKDNNH